MTRSLYLILIGGMFIAMPFLGFPSLWKEFFYVIAGALLVVIGAASYIMKPAVQSEHYEVVTEVFAETDRADRI